jgi:hypothetical protein
MDPDPITQMNTDPFLIRIRNPVYNYLQTQAKILKIL